VSAGLSFPGQPGHEDDDPQADLTLMALFEALNDLSTAALIAETDEAHQVDGLLGSAALTAFGFAPDSDEAKGLHLLIGAIRRAAEVTS
jgi:hypothetical protein